MTKARGRVSPERWIVAGLLVGLAVPIVAVGGFALGVPLRIGVLVALALGVSLCAWIARALPREWDGARRTHTVWSILFLVVGLAAVARTAGVAWFIADPTHTQATVYWFDKFFLGHNCYSAIWRAAELARTGAINLYDTNHYEGRIGRFAL